MCQIQHSMKILAKSCLFIQWDMSRQEELFLTFLTYQIKVLVSVLLKNTSNTLLTYFYLWKPQRWKNKIIALFYHNCFLQWWIYIIVYCAITCYILGVKFSPGNSNIIIIMYNISWLMEIYLWRGGRGKAERAKGRAGSKTSGESVGKGIMINTCIWFQWLPGRLEKAPAGLQWGGSNEQQERERPTAEEEQNNNTTEEERRSFVYVLIRLFYFVLLNTLFLARHPWLPRPSFPDPRTALQYCILNLYLAILSF